jgi:hypothetical protein
MPKKKILDRDKYRNNNRQKWLRIEKGLEEDDFSSPFLTHFGFMDYPSKQPSQINDTPISLKISRQISNE